MSNGNLSQEGRIASFIPPNGVENLFLKSMSGVEELGRPFQFDLELLSTGFEVNFDEMIGQSAAVSLNLSNGCTRYFHGVISQFTQTAPEGRLARYRATIVPWLWLLTRSSDSRIFQFENMTVLDILAKVFTDLQFEGPRDVQRLKKQPYPIWDHCVQYRETHFNFLSRLLEHEGLYYFFEHEEDQHTLVLADDPASHDVYEGYSEIRFLPGRGGSGGEYIRDWIAHKKLVPGRVALSDFNSNQPTREFLSQCSQPGAYDHGDCQIHDSPGEFADGDPDDGSGDRYATLRMQEIQARQETFTAESDARGIGVGCKFTLRDFPRTDPNPEFLVCSATHLIQQNPYEAGSATGGSGDSYRCSFSAIRADRPFRPARLTPKPVIQGPQNAIVVGPPNEEIHTDGDGKGHIRVHFPWDRHHPKRSEDNLFPEDSSCWIPVSHLWAGENWGAFFLPRIGQEVLVEFLEGDPDCPVITGRVYDGDHKPPYALPANKTQSGIKTRSSKQGTPGNYNEIQFEDKKGEEKINIHAEKDLSVSVENNKSESVQGNKSISVDGTHTETIKKDTTIKIVEGKLDHDVVAGTAKHHVKGEVTELYDNKQTTYVKNEISITSETAHIYIHGSTNVQLHVGASKLWMASDGSILLEGQNIAINGKESVNIHGGSVTSKADTNHQTNGATVVSEASATNTIKGPAGVMLNPT